MTKPVLFLYLTKHSGHYSAAVAVEQVLRRLDPQVETMLLDSFSHANPLLSKMTLKAYLAVLKAAPEIWEYMYDNPEFKERTENIRRLLNKGNSRKLQKVLTEFAPAAVVCTQAFACGVIASWKRATGNRSPALVGILTDFVAHRYWADDQVDLYIAPNEETKQTLLAQGVSDDRVKVCGIPIHERYAKPLDRTELVRKLGLSPDLPKILVMGGSLGLGPMKSVIRKLDRLPQPFEILVVAGQNDRLQADLQERGVSLRHPTRIMGFVDNMHEYMEIAEVLVTKPGGITTAEALAKQAAMIIINPIPGQEAKNTEFLLAHQVAVKAETPGDVMRYVDEFLRDPRQLRQMRAAARDLGRPHAAENAAQYIYDLLTTRHPAGPAKMAVDSNPHLPRRSAPTAGGAC